MTPPNQTVSNTGPAATLNFTDPSTWVMILSIIAGIVAAVWPGKDLNPQVQAFAPVAASIVTAGVLISKHHLAAALVSTAVLVPQIVSDEHAVAAIISQPAPKPTPAVIIQMTAPPAPPSIPPLPTPSV